jgi:hypothetical protein
LYKEEKSAKNFHGRRFFFACFPEISPLPAPQYENIYVKRELINQ